MAQLLLVDDHPVVRQGLMQLLSAMDEVECIHEAGTPGAAIDEFRTQRPDAVILDLSLGGKSGLDVLRRMSDIDASVPIMILSMHDESLHAERALIAGAKGYVMKHEAAEKVVDGVRKLLAGELVFSKALQDRILMQLCRRSSGHQAQGGIAALTDKELEILRMIGMGYPTSQIATQLARSVKTIEAHRASIRKKLRMESAFELVHFAMHWAQE